MTEMTRGGNRLGGELFYDEVECFWISSRSEQIVEINIVKLQMGVKMIYHGCKDQQTYSSSGVKDTLDGVFCIANV